MRRKTCTCKEGKRCKYNMHQVGKCKVCMCMYIYAPGTQNLNLDNDNSRTIIDMNRGRDSFCSSILHIKIICIYKAAKN